MLHYEGLRGGQFLLSPSSLGIEAYDNGNALVYVDVSDIFWKNTNTYISMVASSSSSLNQVAVSNSHSFTHHSNDRFHGSP